MLKPCVGMMCVMSSSDSFLRIVVFPLLSRPRTSRRASWSDCERAKYGVDWLKGVCEKCGKVE